MGRQRNNQRLERKSKCLDVLPTILIVTEGAETEPNYFKGFGIPSLTVKISGIGHVTTSLVEATKNINKSFGADIVWCVFDCDDFNDFDAAVKLAKEYGFKVAYSVEAFEFWYLLHFNLIDTQLSRQQYEKKIRSCIGKKYEKNNQEMYELLLPHQENAIRNAKRIEEMHNDNRVVLASKRNPSTTVHHLVEELNKYL